MERLQIKQLQLNQIDETVELFLDAFRTEAFTAALLDLSARRARNNYYHLVKLKLALSLELGQPLPIARLDGRIAGFAIVKAPQIIISKRRVVWKMLPSLHHMAFLLPYFIRGAYLGRAVRPPANLPEMHHTLEGLAVHPAYQGRGLGRRLLEHVERLARGDPGASGIYLLTGDERNRRIYEKASYRVIEARPARNLTAYHMFNAFL